MSHPLFDRHKEKLDGAVAAVASREHWSAYPEMPSGKIYGENARDEGAAAFEGRMGKAFELDQPGTVGTVGGERSPYGRALDVTYPQVDLDVLLPAATRAMESWAKASIEDRVGVCMEILQRLNAHSFELAGAVMHTTGQGFMMAFQAGGPHAQDRGLEALAYAFIEMTRCPAEATWKKRVGKEETVTLKKTFRVVPRGVSVLVGCSTFPTWNSYPGLFASLATGNAVVVKPHPGAVLPLAITVEIARGVLSEEGFDPNLVTLVADSADAPITESLVTRPEVRIVDYTGGSAFGDWIEAHAKQAVVFTEKAGVNSTIIDGVGDLRASSGNIAFSLCLYSGQMCTTPQNIFIPKGGIETGNGHKSFDEVAQAIVGGVNWLLGDAGRATEVLGAIQNERTLERIEQATTVGEVLRKSESIVNERFPDARVRSPLIVKLGAGDEKTYMSEWFGPISFIIETQDTNQSIELAARAGREVGGITCGVYATDDVVIARAVDALSSAGVATSCNLTGSIWVNQSAAFSDFHVSGGNPAGNATLCDGAFVATRFRTVQSRVMVG